MPKIKIEKLGAGDQSWIGAGSIQNSNRTEWMQTSDFAGKASGGVIPSGTALALVNGQLKPYNHEGGDDTAKLIGFLAVDVPVGAGKVGVAVFDAGRVRVERLPDSAFTVPAPEKNLTAIVFVKKGA